MSTSAVMKKHSVAEQQKIVTKVDYAKLTNAELHQETQAARNTLYGKCVDTQQYIVDVLLPRCEAIITRYKMQGVASKDRPNGKPTVEAYFRSIELNYNTVRSWIHRKRLQTEMFQSKKSRTSKKTTDKVRHLTELEARLLGTATIGHDLVKAIKRGGNLDDAVKEFLENAPTPERIEEYIERPVDLAADRLKGLEAKELVNALIAEIRCLTADSGNSERVHVGSDSEDPTTYNPDINCFAFTVRVANDGPPANESPVHPINVGKGGAQ